MLLHFSIAYSTQWGESLCLTFSSPSSSPFFLSTTDGHLWKGTLHFPLGFSVLSYTYEVWKEGKCVRKERVAHQLQLPTQPEGEYWIEDHWRTQPEESYLYTSAFSRQTVVATEPLFLPFASSITLRVLHPDTLKENEALALLGEGHALGDWEASHALLLSRISPFHWQLTLNANLLSPSQSYKIIKIDCRKRELLAWELSDNRHFDRPSEYGSAHCILPEFEVKFENSVPRVAGTAVPVFSLRSQGSQGVGDFGDLKMMIDWLVCTGQKALQILPINDTTASHTHRDSYPYSAISIYAFHPMYIDLRQVASLADKEQHRHFAQQWRQLNALPELDYEGVNKVKRDYLRCLFRQERETLVLLPDFQNFVAKNEHWLYPYAAFSYLRDKYASPLFTEWPEHRSYDEHQVAQLCQPNSPSYEQVLFYIYLQYLLHGQLLEVSRYARQQGVILKGDIPIGISRTSVEAWKEPHYFKMNGQAGAPPDAFSTTGQNWGFPTYNWETMRQDGYLWWKQRFSKMAEYFTAYRIDHILGFFRIWEIPIHSQQGLLGHFSPSLPLSVEEIERWGLPFQRDFMTRPFICDDLLQRLFGHQLEWVCEHFLQHSHYDIWTLRSEFSTQQQIADAFSIKARHLPKAKEVLEGLFSLVNNVLFIEDTQQPQHYHPRISAQQTFIFERLQAFEKSAFNALYQHYYYERHNRFWYDEAMQKLPALIDSTPMLACGEDLGMVPECVPWLMQELQILSLEIERMPKSLNTQFGHPATYPRASVCTMGTHDMSTFRGWWEEERSTTENYFYTRLQRGGLAPVQAPGWLCSIVVQQHLDSPSLLAILALQDWMSVDETLRLPDVQAERINVPSNPEHYWRYRMHLTIDTLLQQEAFNQQLLKMVRESGRAV